MRDLKYIIIRIGGFIEVPIIFNGMLSHSQIAESFLNNSTVEIISAGFCCIKEVLGDMVVIEVTGEAFSLNNLHSREEDNKIIEETLNRTKIF